MRTAQFIFRSLTAALAATASLLLCLTVSCRRAPAPLPDDFGVTVLIDNPSSSDGTKAIADNEINSIAIFAFSAGSGELAGYVYESELTGKTTFPMTLKASGAIDFYAIANPDPGYFRIVGADGNLVDLRGTSAANPPEYNGTDIQKWRVEINDASSRPGEAAPWYAPMTNLPGAGGTNRRYTIDPDDNWTVIPLELTRAVSKIEVWFRAKNNLDNRNPLEAGNGKYYYKFDKISLSSPVLYTPLYSSGYGENGDKQDLVEENLDNSIFQINFETFSDAGGDNYYSDKFFINFRTYYILPNSKGGDQNGNLFAGVSESECTVLNVTQSYVDTYSDGLIFKDWYWNEPVNKKEKSIYIPSFPRNHVINVWCDLTDDIDRSFTYTVVDWDETVEVNVPDFE